MNIPESQRRELKETWRDDYLKTIAAFANTEGGTFYIGVTDKGIVTGIEKSKKLLEDLPNKITNSLGINAGVYIQQEGDKEYIKISIPKSSLPISCQSRYYIRSGSTTHELKGGELQDFILKNNNMSWDEVTIPGVSFEEINEDAVRVFIRKATAINRLPLDIDVNDTQLLFKNLGLMGENGELTRAALLLFSKYPTRYTRSADFRIGRFRNNDPTDLITQDLIEGDVFRMPDKVVELLRSKYLFSPIAYEGLQRLETLEIPEKALREAILNAIIHRDYSSVASIQLSIFDEELNIWNPGCLMPPLCIESLKEKHPSYPRNKLLASVFYRAGYIESWGRGILTIIRETLKGGLEEPVFKDHVGGLEVTFRRNTTLLGKEVTPPLTPLLTPLLTPPLTPPRNLALTELEEKILEEIKKNNKITRRELAESLQVGVDTIKEYIRNLKRKGALSREGGNMQSGRWRIIE